MTGPLPTDAKFAIVPRSASRSLELRSFQQGAFCREALEDFHDII